LRSPTVRLSAPRFMSLTSTNYTQRHLLFTGRRNNGADYHLVYLITSIRDVRGYRSNGQVGRTTASACACTEITLRTLQDSKVRARRQYRCDVSMWYRQEPIGTRLLARLLGVSQATNALRFLTHVHCHAIDATANRSRRSRRVAGQNTTNRLTKPKAYGVPSQTMGLSRPADLVLVRQF
jgi:hypothetical protein